jgi:PPOX class probable FMN-dependent enzyme
MPFEQTLTTEDELRERYGFAPGPPRRKIIDHVDEGAAEFIAASPFFVFATSSDGGCDASPRGGPPGFVKVLDPGRIAFADLSGNRLLDSFTNLVHQPEVGLIFMIPGMDETLRVNGRASLTIDPAVLETCQIGDRPAKTAVGIDVDEAYIHCAKAFRRGGVWDTSSWLAESDRPSAACILRDHVKVDVDPQVIHDELEKGYAITMWEAGGGEPPA